jgi:hypothetical protein
VLRWYVIPRMGVLQLADVTPLHIRSLMRPGLMETRSFGLVVCRVDRDWQRWSGSCARAELDGAAQMRSERFRCWATRLRFRRCSSEVGRRVDREYISCVVSHVWRVDDEHAPGADLRSVGAGPQGRRQ